MVTRRSLMRLRRDSDLVVPFLIPTIFKAKRTTASISTTELQTTSVKMREYILETCRSSGDPELDASTYRATQDEHDRGWIWGPVDPTTLPSKAHLDSQVWDLADFR